MTCCTSAAGKTEKIETLRPTKHSIVVVALLTLLLAGCSREVTLAGRTADQPQDFTGSWELNYQLSESVQDKTRLLLQMAEIEARRRNEGGLRGLPSYELVELTDKISQATVLEINQGEQEIEVQRGEEFPLTCTFRADRAQVEKDPLGTEICGWQNHQLVFDYQLPDQLRVTHILTLGPGGNNLNVATTVRSRGYGQVFTLNRVYTKFVPLPDEYECEFTVTHGKSCRRADPDQSNTVIL